MIIQRSGFRPIPTKCDRFTEDTGLQKRPYTEVLLNIHFSYAVDDIAVRYIYFHVSLVIQVQEHTHTQPKKYKYTYIDTLRSIAIIFSKYILNLCIPHQT